jgi:hypothetical protein
MMMKKSEYSKCRTFTTEKYISIGVNFFFMGKKTRLALESIVLLCSATTQKLKILIVKPFIKLLKTVFRGFSGNFTQVKLFELGPTILK